MLEGDHLLVTRSAVAEVLRESGMAHLAEQTLRGQGDGLPLMQAAARAVERVVKGMFE